MGLEADGGFSRLMVDSTLAILGGVVDLVGGGGVLLNVEAEVAGDAVGREGKGPLCTVFNDLDRCTGRFRSGDRIAARCC